MNNKLKNIYNIFYLFQDTRKRRKIFVYKNKLNGTYGNALNYTDEKDSNANILNTTIFLYLQPKYKNCKQYFAVEK